MGNVIVGPWAGSGHQQAPRTRITRARKMQGLSRADVGSLLGVSEQSVRRWEKGKAAIPDDQQLALSGLFGISVPYLMGQVG